MTTDAALPDWNTFDWFDGAMVIHYELEILELAGNPETSPSILSSIGNTMSWDNSAREIAQALYGNPSTPATMKRYLEIEFSL